MESVLKPFGERTAARGRYGFDWVTIIAIILPIIIDCFQGPDELEQAAKGLTPLQRIGLRQRVRREVGRMDLGLRVFQRAAAARDAADAIEAELTATANSELMQGDVFAAAFEEALKLGGQ